MIISNKRRRKTEYTHIKHEKQTDWLIVCWIKSKEEIRQFPLEAFPVNRVMLVVSQNPIKQPNIT